MPACAPASNSERVSTPCATCVRRSIARSSTVSLTPSGANLSVTRAASSRSKRISVSAPVASCTNANSSPGWMWRSADASSCEFNARCRSPGESPFSWKMSASDWPARTVTRCHSGSALAPRAYAPIVGSASVPGSCGKIDRHRRVRGRRRVMARGVGPAGDDDADERRQQKRDAAEHPVLRAPADRLGRNVLDERPVEQRE